MEHVNHPKHYNQHPAGIECIDIIRHYTCDIANAIKYLWRAGLKPEMGKEDAAKEIEDLEKALWYIEDYKKNFKRDEESIIAPIMSMTMKKEIVSGVPRSMSDHWIKEQAGHDIIDIIKPYDKNISVALGCLLHVGFIYENHELTPDDYKLWLDKATNAIHRRILDIDTALLDNEVKDLNTMMSGYGVEGMHYAKPACIRETEPEHYDPLNIIIRYGTAYSLSDKIRKKDNGSLYTPCENCDLRQECYDFDECRNLCGRLHDAANNEYYKEVGSVKYSPSFGTIEVYDEMKELEIERKKLDAELNEEDQD